MQGDWERRSAEDDYRKHMREEVQRSEDYARELRNTRQLQVFIILLHLCFYAMGWSYKMKIIRSNRLNLFRKKHGGVFMKKLKI